jgi:hypothetical protein
MYASRSQTETTSAAIWLIGAGLAQLPHMAGAKDTTLNEVREMLTHVVEHTATKQDDAKLDMRINDHRTEMIDQLQAVRGN